MREMLTDQKGLLYLCGLQMNGKNMKLLTVKGEKLERWGKYLLVRPDPQVIWDTPKTDRGWKNMNGHYHRSKKGGGEWEFFNLPQQWQIFITDRLLLI